MKLDPRRRPLSLPQIVAGQLALGRTAVGTFALVAPVAAARLTGLDTATARRVSWLSRMLAGRDAALAVGALAGIKGGGGRGWLLAGAVADAVDAVAVAGAVKQGRLKGLRPRAVVVVGSAAAAAGVWAALARPRE